MLRSPSLVVPGALLALALTGAVAPPRHGNSTGSNRGAEPRIRIWKIHYRANNGARRNAFVVLPSWYGPHNHPPIPLVISPHGRGLSARANAKLWRTFPAIGRFAVVNPEGQGRRLSLYSWGYKGQIDDLAKMPEDVGRALPWLHIERHRVFAVGSSMGGQETLLLLARHPRLLAGAAAFDSVADLARQYRDFPLLGCDSNCLRRWRDPRGLGLQGLMRYEVGGSPETTPEAYASRSPLAYVRRIALSCVPLEIWWSTADRVVLDQREQSGELFSEIRRLKPRAPVLQVVGHWTHSAELREGPRLRRALRYLGLLRPSYGPERRIVYGPDRLRPCV
jgi:pimeloyl-ACP methyl ester carboxylesterase